MSEILKDRYGATFVTDAGTFHSYRDLGLLPNGRPRLETPESKGDTLDVPGKHGRLFTHTWLTGSVVYDTRAGSLPYLIRGSERERYQTATRLYQLLHMREARVILDEEPDVYWHGWLSVDAPTNRKGVGADEVDISGVFDPFRMDLTDSTEDWEWDSFNFETGVARDYGEITVDGTEVLEFVSSPMGGSPEFYTSNSGMTVTVDGVTYDLTANDWTVIPDIVLPTDYSAVEMVFGGDGDIIVRYRGGRL